MGKGEGTLSAVGTRWLRGLVVLLVSFLTASAAAQAATIKVNTTKDLATSAGGKCSLRLAIATVNSPGTKTACGVADQTSDLIVLGPNTYKLTIPPAKGNDDNSSGDLNLTSKVPLLQMVGSGPGATLIQGSSKLHDRLLTISSKKSSLVISGMTMLGGHAPDGAAGSTSGVCALGVGTGVGGVGQNGGAILNQGGSLFLFLVTVSGNHAGNGGAGAPASTTPATGCDGGSGGSGGGIYNAGGYVNVTSSTISGNHAGTGGLGGDGASGATGTAGGNGGAGGSGGGIANAGGNVVIGGTTVLGAGDTIASNHAGPGGHGGAGGNSSANNTDGGNGGAGGRGGNGGGLSTTDAGSTAGSLGVTNSTLTANGSGAGGNGGRKGTGSGGKPGTGGDGGAGGGGGGISGASSPSRMASATIASNSTAAGGRGGKPGGKAGAAGEGGGVYVNSSASTNDMTLQNTLVASNMSDNCAAPSRPIVNGGYDLSFGDKTCPAVTHGDPKLKKLSDYGGFTYTMALEPGSAAINRGPPKGAGCPARDQRAVRRPQGKACDIGAFEFAVPTVTIYTPRNRGHYKRGSKVLADYRCTEGGSSTTPITPIASCNGTVFTGSRINTRTLGRKTFTVTARDLAGNKTVKTIHYTVVKRR